MVISKEDRALMIQWVRLVIESRLEMKPAESPDFSDYPSCGAFVTIHKNGKLRGCIGYTVSQAPLEETLKDAALSAAFSDPRFPPLSLDELPQIDIEISLLTPPEKIMSPDELELGKHGAILKSGVNSGLFLPQVATEQRWDLTQFMNHLCIKAGLPSSHWQSEKYELFRFSAEILSEK